MKRHVRRDHSTAPRPADAIPAEPSASVRQAAARWRAREGLAALEDLGFALRHPFWREEIDES